VLVLLLFPFLGLAYLEMDSMGAQSSCPFMPGHLAVLCQANPAQHIQELQSMFNAVPQGSAMLAALLFLAAASAIASSLKKVFAAPPKLLSAATLYYRVTVPRNALQEAYSHGILNTKAF
jgi:hypothetical protein